MLARPERFELPTLGFEVRCSIQLSYGRAVRRGIRRRNPRDGRPPPRGGTLGPRSDFASDYFGRAARPADAAPKAQLSSRRTIAAPVDHRLELAEGDLARQIFHAAIGRRDQPLGRQVLQPAPDARGHRLRRLDLRASDRSSTPSMTFLGARSFSTPRSIFGCALSIEMVDGHRVGQLGQERIARAAWSRPAPPRHSRSTGAPPSAP